MRCMCHTVTLHDSLSEQVPDRDDLRVTVLVLARIVMFVRSLRDIASACQTRGALYLV